MYVILLLLGLVIATSSAIYKEIYGVVFGIILIIIYGYFFYRDEIGGN